MKLRTKLLSVLGATAIATTGVTAICSCTFTRKPYSQPKLTYVGSTELNTNEGETTLDIPNFKLDRKILEGEVFSVKAIDPTTSNESEGVTATLRNNNNSDGFVVSIALSNVTDEYEEVSSSFKLSFKSTYESKEHDVTLEGDKTFTVTYVPKIYPYKILYDGNASEPIQAIKTREFSINFKIYDSTGLNEMALYPNTNIVSAASTNSKVSVVGEPIVNVDRKSIKLNMLVTPVDDYVFAEETFNINFFFRHYNIDKPDPYTSDSLTVEYVPKWKDISVLCYNKEFNDEIDLGILRGTNQASIISKFYLSRALDSDTENLSVSVVDNDKVTIGTIAWSSNKKDFSIPYTLNITGQEEQEQEFKFGLKFTITKDGEDTPKEFIYTKMLVNYQPVWENNDVTDTDPTTPYVVNATTTFVAKQRYKLIRALKGSDEIGLSVVQQAREDGSLPVEITSKNIVQHNSDWYVDINFKLNLLRSELFGSDQISFDFGIKFDFKNNGNIKNTNTLNTSVTFMPNSSGITVPSDIYSEQPGNQYFAFDATLEDDTVYDSVSLTATSAGAGYAIDDEPTYTYNPGKGTISVEIQFIPTSEQIYDDHDDILINLDFTATKSGATTTFPEVSTTLHYWGLEQDPEEEQSIESYIHDRSFSLMCYSRANTSSSYTVNYATAWIFKDAPEGPLPTNSNDANASQFGYYVATSYDTYVNFTQLYLDYVNRGYTGEFGIGVADYSMQQTYKTSSGKEESGLKFDTDYMMLDPYYAFSFEENTDNFLWSTQEQSFKGTSNIYIGRINFAYTLGSTDIQRQRGSSMNIHFKNKLAKIQSWIKEGKDVINFKEAPQTGEASWNADEIVQGGFPTKTITNESYKNINLAYWYEGWWHSEDSTSKFKTQYYTAAQTWNSSSGIYYNQYLDSAKTLRHYSPTYRMSGYISSSSIPLLSPGSLVAYRDPNNGKIEIFGVYWGLVDAEYYYGQTTAFDVMSDGNRNLLDHYLKA